MKIPLVDLKAQYISIKSDIDKAVSECISDANFIKGKAVTDFESAFADYLGTKYCIGCGNGTDALEIILIALNIGPGDEVIVPALTWISTAEAVNNVGAEPVFVDIDPRTYTIASDRISDKITKKTKAIIPVHLYGYPADMIEICSIAETNGLFVIEDCAQAHGADISGKKVGTFGIASAFSFFPSKNLGAYGDGGAIVTRDKDLAELARRISNHGQLKEKHQHSRIGRNSRLDTIQASVLNVKLKHLDEWNQKRQKAAFYFMSRLSGCADIILPFSGQNMKHVYHLFVLRSKFRDKIIKQLDENEISWGIHYPKPLPFTDAYGYKKHKQTDFKVASEVSQEILSIPVYPEITEAQLSFICDQILKV